MSSYLDDMVNETMKKQVDAFFASIREGGAALGTFLNSLTTFSDTVRLHHDKLQPETLLAVHGFSTLIDSVSSNLLELEIATQKVQEEITEEVSTILNGRLDNLTIDDGKWVSHQDSASNLTFVKQSMQWLLMNLHHPYPPKEVKKAISKRWNIPVKDIDAWFVDIRRRIGWNRIRKTHFSNKQDKIIAAAKRFFTPTALTGFSADPNFSVDEDFEICVPLFLQMEEEAKRIYCDMYPTEVLDICLSRCSTKNELQAMHSPLPHFFYPTPEPSPSHSSPSPPSTPEPPADHSHSILGKRHKSPCGYLENGYGESESHQQKRARFNSHHTDMVVPVASLPSPATTIDFSEDTTDIFPPSLEPTTPSPIPVAQSLKGERKLSITETKGSYKQSPDTFAVPAVPDASLVQNSTGILEDETSSGLELCATLSAGARVSRKRKRRLSDCTHERSPKRPTAFSFPRLQTVSNPLPTANTVEEVSLDSWLHTYPEEFNFNVSDTFPSPINSESLLATDQSTLEVEVQPHQYSYSPYPASSHMPEDTFQLDATFDLIDLSRFTDVLKSQKDRLNLGYNSSTGQEGMLNFGLMSHDHFNALPAVSYEVGDYFLAPQSYSRTRSSHFDEVYNTEASSTYIPDSFSYNHYPLTPSEHSIIGGQEIKRALAQALRQELEILEKEINGA